MGIPEEGAVPLSRPSGLTCPKWQTRGKHSADRGLLSDFCQRHMRLLFEGGVCVFLLSPTPEKRLLVPLHPSDIPESICHPAPRPPQWASAMQEGPLGVP